MEQQPRDESRAATVREGGAESWAEAGEYIDNPNQMPVSVGSRTPSSTGSEGGGMTGMGAGTSGTGTGTSGMGTGTSGMGTGTSGMGTGTSGMGTGTSGMGPTGSMIPGHAPSHVETRSPTGSDFSSSSDPAGQGSNTPVGAEPERFQQWDARQPAPSEGFAGGTSMPSMSTVAGLAATATIGGLAYAWWRRRQARRTRAARMRAALLALGASAGAELPKLLPSDLPRMIGQSAAHSRSAWLPFLLLPIGLWLRQRGRSGERASEQLLEPLDLETRSQRLARQGADLLESYGRRWIRDVDPYRDDDGWGWTPWLVGGAIAGGAYAAYRQGWIGTSAIQGMMPASSGTSQSLVRDVMTRGVETASPDATIAEVARRMRDLDVGSLPVCDGHRLIGMVTDRDLSVRATAEGKDPNNTRVREVMSPEVVWVFDDEPAAMAASVMRQRQIRRLPVLDRSDRLVGVVALGDLATDLGDDRLKGATLEEISQPTAMGGR